MSDQVTVTCPKCNKEHRVPRERIGRKGKCSCGNVLVVQEAPSAAPMAACASCGARVYDAELVCPACGKYTRAEKPVEPKASGVSDAPGNRQVSGAKAGAPTSDVLKAAKGRNGTLELLQGKVRIRREGFGNLMLFGLKGDKEIRISQIGSIQFRRPGPILSGYIQFTFLGGTEAQGGQWQAGTDENSVVFDKTQQPDFEEMKSLIEAQIAAGERGEAATGGIGDLEKLAELRDRGIISEEEFSAKKKQILGNGA